MTPPRYHVIFRTCDLVNAVHGTRPFGLQKRQLIMECFLSLWKSLRDYPHSVHVLGDKISPELTAFFEKIQTLDGSITISSGDYGNDESIRQSLARALERADDEWVYLCEDDYLHVPNAFEWINELLVTRATTLDYVPRRRFMNWFVGGLSTKPLILHPADSPDRYKADQKTLSFLALTRFNHWRQVGNATFTLLAQAKTFKRYGAEFLRSARGANDDYLSHWVLERLPWRGRALCLSPIPGVACHLHERTLTPLVDWAAVHAATEAEVLALMGPESVPLA